MTRSLRQTGQRLLGGLAVEPRSLQQVRGGVADVGDRDPTGVDVREQRTALQRVVDHLSLGAHPRHSTRHPLSDRPDHAAIFRARLP